MTPTPLKTQIDLSIAALCALTAGPAPPVLLASRHDSVSPSFRVAQASMLCLHRAPWRVFAMDGLSPMTQTKQGGFGNWAQDRAVRAVLWSILRLPYAMRVNAMGTLLAKVIGPLAGYRKRAEDNLTLIYPDLAPDERRKLAIGVCDNFGRTLIENYSHREMATRLSATQPTGRGLNAVKQAHAAGRPVLFVTGHFGNFEAPRHVLTQNGYVVGGLYRAMANTYTNAHYARTMTDWGGPVFEQGRRGTIGFARHLRAGGMATLLFDVMSYEGKPIDFMGKPAMTSLAAAEFALKFDALLVPYFGIRQTNGLDFEVVIEEPIAHSDAITMMTEVTQRLEARIAANPAQWFWVHRRWKPAHSRT